MSPAAAGRPQGPPALPERRLACEVVVAWVSSEGDLGLVVRGGDRTDKEVFQPGSPGAVNFRMRVRAALDRLGARGWRVTPDVAAEAFRLASALAARVEENAGEA
jgi:hypothetical protein